MVKRTNERKARVMSEVVKKAKGEGEGEGPERNRHENNVVFECGGLLFNSFDRACKYSEWLRDDVERDSTVYRKSEIWEAVYIPRKRGKKSKTKTIKVRKHDLLSNGVSGAWADIWGRMTSWIEDMEESRDNMVFPGEKKAVTAMIRKMRQFLEYAKASAMLGNDQTK